MRRLAMVMLFTALTSTAQTTPPLTNSQASVQPGSTTTESWIVVPPGTTISLRQ
jgi:hypothetical protein